MGRAMELISGFATAAGAYVNPVVMDATTPNVIRSFPLAAFAYLLTMWLDSQVAGELRIMSPRMHDQVQGIHCQSPITEIGPMIPPSKAQPLYPQDTLQIGIQGSAVGGDIETMGALIYYDDLPGIDANLVSWDDIKDNIVNLVTSRNALVLGGGGGFTGGAAFNATENLLKANTKFAVLGYTVDVECAAVRMVGSDTGNLGVGGPGDPTKNELNQKWFKYLSQESGLPCIPVIDSANVGAILVSGAQDENAANVQVAWLLAELPS